MTGARTSQLLRGLLPRSIRMQTLLISLGPAVVIALMLTGYLAHNQVQYQERELEQTGQLIASQLAPAAEYGVLTGNRLLLQDLVEGSMQRVPSLHSIEIHDSEGQVLARARQEGQPGELTRPFIALIYREQVALDEHFLGGSQSEPMAPMKLGELQVRMTRTALKQRQQDTLFNAAGFALIALLITAMVAIALAHSLSRPLRAMGNALRRIEDGNYRSPLAEQGPGELGDLARHINQLAGALERAEQQQERNIRELTAARVEAEQANQAKSSFLAMMSHELRTPLNGVFGMLQLLATTRQTTEQNEYTQLAMESTDHLLNVINDILDLSRIERGSLQLEAIPFKPHELISRTVEAFRPSAEQKQLALELYLPAELAPMETIGDPTRLRQILVNLLGNAIKFTAAGRISVEVSLPERDEQRLVLRCLVRDTGIGIAPEQMQRMFQAFEQADTSTSRCYGGTGLGLTIARDLAERMGGLLSADSRPGAGSTFWLELPLPWRPARRNLPASTSELTRGDDRRLLLVEDDPVNRFVIKSLLEQQGFHVEHASDGQQALGLAGRCRYDAILMDCQLPLIDGLEVTRRIRAGSGPNGTTPIIALTANAQRDNRQACLLAGMNDYLSKPVRLSEVQAALDCWLGTRP